MLFALVTELVPALNEDKDYVLILFKLIKSFTKIDQ